MLRLVDHALFGARISAPENKNQVGAIFVEVLNDVLGKSFPAFAAMTAGKMRFDG